MPWGPAQPIAPDLRLAVIPPSLGPIRAGTATPATGAPDPARSAAQRAFFDTALRKTGNVGSAPVVAPRVETRAVQPAVTQVRSQPAAPEPGRILRPGSLLNITV
jgi:hypothetical protein